MTYQAKNLPKEIQFSIDHLDRFGQGVFKDNELDLVFFIPKTLPGEEGKAKVLKRKGKVVFCKLIEITKSSEIRVPFECQHFAKCQGCDYWSCDYDNEINLKKQSFVRNLRNAIDDRIVSNQTIEDLEVLQDKNRLGYRNRIQLHYSKKQKQIGYRDSQNNIIKINQCLIASEPINKFLVKMLNNHEWLSYLRKSDPDLGHFELYEHENGEVQLSINETYSFGGFSQVNQPMNDQLIQKLVSLVEKHEVNLEENDIVLDLFGGSGNLSRPFTKQRCLIFDGVKSNQKMQEHQIFHEVNLYGPRSIERIQEQLNEEHPKLVILDPPRSGLKNLNDYIEKLKPKHLFYISCQYDSMLRDIRSTKEQIDSIQSIFLCDLFPATHHIEAVSLIKTKY